MRQFPVLETERLNLRQPTEADITPLFRICQDEEVMRFYGHEPFTEEKQVKADIERHHRIRRNNTGLRWIISMKENQAVVGDIGFNGYDKKHKKTEVGFKLAREHWRKGIMSEALCAVLSYIYQETDINRTEALVDTKNPGSFLLLEKAGFQREGILRDYELESEGYVDLMMLSILRKDWHHRK